MVQRKSKPKWFALLDRVNAIREAGFCIGRDLAKYLGVPEQRVAEWAGYLREARAEKVLEIQEWVETKEREIRDAGKWPKYQSALRKLRSA